MNGIKGKLWAKLLAFVIFSVSAVVLAGSCLAVIFFVETDSFFDGGEGIKSSVLENCIYNKLIDVENLIAAYAPYKLKGIDQYHDYDADTTSYQVVYNIQNENDLLSQMKNESDILNVEWDTDSFVKRIESEYASGYTNLSVTISDDNGNVIFSNFVPDDYSVKESYVYPVLLSGETVRIFTILPSGDDCDSYAEMLMRHGNLRSYKLIEPRMFEDFEIIADTSRIAEDAMIFDGIFTIQKSVNFNLELCIPKTLTIRDDIFIRFEKVQVLYGLRDWFVAFIPISAVFFLASAIFLISSSGYSDRIKGARLMLVDKIPFEFYIASVVLALMGFWEIFDSYRYYASILICIILFTLGAAVFSVFVLVSLMTFAARCKTGKFFITTLTFGSFIYAYRLLRYLVINRKVSTKIILLSSAVFIFDLLCLAAVSSGEDGALFVFFVEKVLLCLFIIRYGVGMDRIKSGCKKLSEGETDVVIDEKGMTHSLKCIAQNLNSIGNGIQLAVEEKMKSERLKTELITNVSHDLKTPLTSIVNYVDILSKEDIRPDSAKEYVGILVRQSQRMKKLIDDLVEASKASSGVIPVNLERTDMSLLLTQAVAEYEERLEKAGVSPVLDLPEKTMPVMIDGRLTWRVFDNLMSNICKYAMKGTRVYVASYEQDSKCYVTFKNISKYALNISPDELMERFVRGDSSRSTEGSGLGLSIAKSLCALQGVDFAIHIDGDLFKAQLSVDIINDDDGIEDDSDTSASGIIEKSETKAHGVNVPVNEAKSGHAFELQPSQSASNADNLNTSVQTDVMPLRSAEPSCVVAEDNKSDANDLIGPDKSSDE